MKNPTGLPFLGVLLFALTVFVGGCGSPPPPPAPTYSVGGTLGGLASGQQLVLQNNQTDDLTLSADGPFTFAAKLVDGAAYSVTVKTQPQGQTCTVTNGSGTLSGADVSNVQVSCSADPGTLDTSFGSDGVVVYDGGGYDRANAIALDADGKILVAGYRISGSSYNMALWRYQADGTPDNSFGSDPNTNFVTYNGGYGASANAIALDASGKILVAGYVSNGSDKDMALWLYRPNGSPDPNFAINGLRVYDSSDDDEARAVTVDSSGRILVAGTVGSLAAQDMALWRFFSDGSPDTGFGTNGLVTYDSGHSDFVEAVALDTDGNVLLAGTVRGVSNYDMALLRYDSSGAPDNSFGGNNGTHVVTYDSGQDDSACAVVLDAGGNILLAGTTNNGPYAGLALLRYHADGTPDNTFGVNSGTHVVTYDSAYYDAPSAVTYDASGKILVAGTVGNGSNADTALWRYGPNGVPDAIFGDSGLASYDGGQGEKAYAMTLDASGKILLAGYADNSSDSDMALWRYNP
ncbi:hypothetical protein ACMC9I_08110 [Deinococcota bacterium DY0809b]